MPYVPPHIREKLANAGGPEDPGELNYIISTIVGKYMQEQGLSYAVINEVIGVLECAKLEVYRRIAGPYENRKLLQNGDVYGIEAE